MHRLGLLDPEDEATMILQNVSNCSPDVALRRRPESLGKRWANTCI